MRLSLTGVGAILVAALAVTADFCAKGSIEIVGNWFCQPVTAITYNNVGVPGSYKDITEMSPNGQCYTTPKAFSGPIAPLDEEVSLHFRGPIQLKQFATYASLVSTAEKREVSPAQIRRHGHQHDAFHNRANANNGVHAEHKRQEVTATIDGKVVSWQNDWFGQVVTSPQWVTATIDSQTVSWINDWFRETATASITALTSSASSAQWVTATIDGKVVSWINNWFGDAPTPAGSSGAAPMASSIQMVTATINGEILSWANNWFSGAPTPTPTSVSASAPTSDESAPTPPSIFESSSPTVSVPAKVENAFETPKPAAASEALVATSSGPALIIDSSTTYERIGYYDSVSQTLDNLVFLGNYGGQGSGVFDEHYGASLSYVNCNGTGGASSPQILADITLPSDTEVIIMSNKNCDDGGCGYVRPGTIAYHGFPGADKVFMFEFAMPLDGDRGFNGDMPAIWALNAKIPRTLQYGNDSCSCWESGCGEFDIAEALFSGSTFLKSTLHTDSPAGDSDYIIRPTLATMKVALVFSSGSSTIHIQVVPDSMDFPLSITAGDLEGMCTPGPDNLVSLFTVS